jgi:hypothetical protein
MDSIIGVVFPLHKNVIDFMFLNKRDVFVKYTSRPPKNKRQVKIREGMKMYIYESGGSKEIIGEAIINKYDYLDMLSILNTYPERLMIPVEDFKLYAEGREEKKALVMELSNLKKYASPMKLLKPITMAGLYLTNDKIKELFVQKR